MPLITEIASAVDRLTGTFSVYKFQAIIESMEVFAQAHGQVNALKTDSGIRRIQLAAERVRVSDQENREMGAAIL